MCGHPEIYIMVVARSPSILYNRCVCLSVCLSVCLDVCPYGVPLYLKNYGTYLKSVFTLLLVTTASRNSILGGVFIFKYLSRYVRKTHF